MKIKSLCICYAAFFSFPLFAKDCPEGWHKSKIKTGNTYFIPYELWMGSKWNGKKEIPNFSVENQIPNYGGKGSTISGPHEWFHPFQYKFYQVYKRIRPNKLRKIQFFTFTKNGIARVFDFRRRKKRMLFYDGNNAKFPAGEGWEIGKPREFKHSRWQKSKNNCFKKKSKTFTVNIEKIKFDACENLSQVVSTFSVNGKLDHRYWFEPEKGMINSKKL